MATTKKKPIKATTDLYAGVWLDHRRAFIATFSTDQSQVKEILSEADEFNPRGGSGSERPYGKQDAISEKNFLERRNQQLHNYYVQLISYLNHVDRICIMGPGMAKTELMKEVNKYPDLAQKVEAITTADNLSEKQLLAKVRKFYEL